jgi:division protein CdvB (Snf7/Vps24/ESCRT-III family)
MSSFFAKWSNERKKKSFISIEGIKNRILENIKSSEPSKLHLEQAQRKLEMQISKMENTSNNFKQKDQKIFNDVTEALQNQDTQKAKSLSNELSKIRKISKVIDSTNMATEQVKLRLETVTELGDVMATLSPARSTIKELDGLSSVLPEADQSLTEISNTLGDVLNSTTSPTSAIEGITSYSDSEEVMKIIEEASAVVEVNTTNKIPDLPSVPSRPFNKISSNNNNGNDTLSSL